MFGIDGGIIAAVGIVLACALVSMFRPATEEPEEYRPVFYEKVDRK